MSTNGASVEDTEMGECEGEKVVTMMDVLQEQQEFEEDANAVLGASDDKNCTYSKGYIKRQAVYACLTCCNEAKHDPDQRAGVCLACSLTCHENHDLVELYTKRNFRCDCGNPKFNNPCQYTEIKTTLNDDNTYNQNFIGLYCTCHRPYPDPDGIEEEMIQCIVCEDWLHASHLEATLPSIELYAEMICKACMDKNEFLHDYSKYAVNGDVNVVDTSEIAESSVRCNGDSTKMNGVDLNTDVEKTVCEEVSVPDEAINDVNPTENMNTSHDNIDENKPDEQKQPNVSGTETADNENPLEENKPELTDHTVSEKTDDGNPIEDNLAKDIVTDETDNANPTEGNKAKDINKEDTQTLIGTFVNKLDDNLDPTVNSRDQENVDETMNKVDETMNKVDETIMKVDETILKVDETVMKGDETIVDETIKIVHQTSNKVDGTTDVTDVNIAEQNKQENPPEIPQEPIENDDDDKGDQKVDDKTNEDLKVDSQEEQAVPSESSTLMSDADKNIETVQVADNQLEDETKDNKRKLSTEESTPDISAKKPKLIESDCLRPHGQRKIFKGATFWPSHFRQKLCTCNECITMYKDLSVLFLTDLEDTVSAYEVLGKQMTDGAASTQYEKGLEALSSLGRIQQINALTEYNKMKDKLLDFLKCFKDRKEVVKEEDIKAFFAGMKPKREPDGVYFCR